MEPGTCTRVQLPPHTLPQHQQGPRLWTKKLQDKPATSQRGTSRLNLQPNSVKPICKHLTLSLHFTSGLSPALDVLTNKDLRGFQPHSQDGWLTRASSAAHT